MTIGARDWGANADEALQDCDSQVCSTFAVDNIGGSGKDSSPACGLRCFPVAKSKQEDGKSAKQAPASGAVAKPRKNEGKSEEKREATEGTEPNSEAA